MVSRLSKTSSAGARAGALSPGVDEAQDLVALGFLGELGVGPGEQARVGVAREEGEDAFLAAAALRDIVLLDQRVVAVIGNGMEVEIEGPSAAELDAEVVDGLVPAVHQPGKAAGVDAAGVFGQRCAFGHGIEAGEQREPRIEGLGHDVGGPSHAPQLEREQRAEGASGGDHRAARHVACLEHGVEIEPREIVGEQEQAAEAGAQAPGPKVEGAAVGDGRLFGPGSLGARLGGAAPEFGQPGLFEHPRHGGFADRHVVLGGQALGDLGRRHVVLLAQGNNAFVAVGSWPWFAFAAAVGEEEGAVGLFAERGAQVAQGAGRIAEPSCRLVEG